MSNWMNLDFSHAGECSKELIDGLTFDQLLIEMSCNVNREKFTLETLEAQFELDLRLRSECARDVFNANKKNLLKHLIKTTKP
jgi:hypothetical protein